jgi:putative ATP-dependent endonuclease of OLD family
VFACTTTFERALVFEGTLEMFARAAEGVGAPKVAANLRMGLAALAVASPADKAAILNPLRTSVLNTAKRFGKARFAQLAASHADQAKTIPKYLGDAVEWLKAG